jgi:hypothetical protein
VREAFSYQLSAISFKTLRVSAVNIFFPAFSALSASSALSKSQKEDDAPPT